MEISRILALAVLGLILAPYGIGNPQTRDKENNQIEVRISSKTKIRVGETLELQVEIWNVGEKQLFIEKDIYQLCSHSPLSLYLELGPALKPGPGRGCAGDCMDDPKASFANRLVEQWISLPVGHSYGTVVRMDPDAFPQLKTPGRWRLRGEYKSNGELSASLCVFSPTPLDQQMIEKLPYKTWRGEAATNMVWVEVAHSRKSSNTTDSQSARGCTPSRASSARPVRPNFRLGEGCGQPEMAIPLLMEAGGAVQRHATQEKQGQAGGAEG
jgi:hypothetical protein